MRRAVGSPGVGGRGGEAKPIGLNRVARVVASRAAREEAVRFFSERFLRFYDRWGHPRVTALRSAERVDEVTARDHFIIGEPAECIERVHEYAELGVDEIACLMNFGNPDLEAVERSMGLFAERVAPLAG